MSASYLDELLKRMLISHFVDEPKHGELVDDANGPLATFSSRIRMCEALGLLRKSEADELHRIRKIRNRFSHEVHISFSDQQIKDLCRALMYRVADNVRGTAFSPQGMFGAATASLILNLINRAAYVAKTRCMARDWPY